MILYVRANSGSRQASAQLRIKAARTRKTNAAAVQPSGFIRVSPRLYASCAVAPASAKAKTIPAKMKKPTKTSNRPVSELMSKLRPIYLR